MTMIKALHDEKQDSIEEIYIESESSYLQYLHYYNLNIYNIPVPCTWIFRFLVFLKVLLVFKHKQSGQSE